MTLLVIAVVVFVVVCLFGFATWVGRLLADNPADAELSEREVERLTRPSGNVHRRG